MKVPLYNTKAENIGETELPDAIFNRPWNPDLVHQAVVMYAANLRQIVAHTKTRGEVRGGGKKPWRQKGTGQARHGSRRSPIWIGGGVTFGPRNDKVYAKKMNKKMRRAALASAISEYVRRGHLKVVEDLTVSEPKTREAQKMIANFFSLSKKPSLLMISSAGENYLPRASRNIPKTDVITGASLNTLDLTQHMEVLIDKRAILEIGKSK
ncbi:MAG: 50S ribosomal protein L4 [bacterium]|nr:50S ribosomal protein L4 [bacterium]